MPTRTNLSDLPSAWSPRLALLLAAGWSATVGFLVALLAVTAIVAVGLRRAGEQRRAPSVG
jgi:hypothetical protein